MLYNKQDKLKHKALFTPQDFLSLKNIKLNLPKTVIFMPSSGSEYIKQVSKKHYSLLADIDVVSDKLAIVSNFGVGGPMTVLIAELLGVCGVQNFVLLGIAGGLSQALEVDDTVLCSGALCDDGTSKDYYGEEVVPADKDLLAKIAEIKVKETGLTWTTDSIFRETKEEVVHYRGHGVKTVEMEAAPLFAFAALNGFKAAGLFVISDLLTEHDWKPHKVAQMTNSVLTERLKQLTQILG